MEVEVSFGWWRERNPADYVIKGDHRRLFRFGDILTNEGVRIVAKGVALEAYQPLAGFPDLFARFAEVRSAEDAIKFVRTFGPLTEEGLRGKGDTIQMVMSGARNMAAGNLHIGFMVCKLDTYLIANHNGLHLQARPNDLFEALWLQYAQAAAAGQANRCRQCKALFATGPDVGRRKGAQFCSVECKTRHFSLKRSR